MDGSTGVDLTISHSSENRTIPTSGQPRLPWREYRTSAFSYGITGKQDRYEGAPLLPQHRGTPVANLSEERRRRNVPPSGKHFVETRARILSRIGSGVKVD